MAYTTIDNPGLYFNTLTWTGNDADSRDITGVGFQPDWVWGKRRDDAAGHNLLDVVRGAGQDSELASNTTGIEGSNAQDRFGFLSAFLSDGFRVEDGSEGSGDKAYWNQNSATYVAWNWKAGGSASSNTDGSVTSSVSANTTAGFSIVTATAPSSGNYTVGHGLSSAPEMVWSKGRDSSIYWSVFASPVTDTNRKFLQLQETNALATSGGDMWGAALPTSSVVGLSAGNSSPANEGFVLYCFHSVKGYSKIGKYTGNGSTDGTFVYTGFKPAWLLTKRLDSSTSGNWNVSDNKRDPSNVVTQIIFADSSQAELTASNVYDYYSNGFKVRESGAGTNASGSTYIFMAFAESPFVNSNGVPNNAR
jgi:hypothetical protein